MTNTIKIIDLKENKVIAELHSGEEHSFIDNEISIRMLDQSGNFFLEVSENCNQEVALNGNKVFEVTEGISGDCITINSNEYVVLSHEQSFISKETKTGIKEKNVIKKIINNIENHELQFNKRQITSAIIILFSLVSILIYQLVSLSQPHDLIKEILPPELADHKPLSPEEIAKIRKDNQLVTIDKKIERSTESEDEKNPSTTKKQQIVKKQEQEQEQEQKKPVKEVPNFNELLDLKNQYLADATYGNLDVIEKIGDTFYNLRAYADQIKNNPSISSLWIAWNKGLISQVTYIQNKKNYERKLILHYLTKYKLFLNNEAIKNKMDYERILEEKIDNVLATADLNQLAAIAQLNEIKQIIPEDHPLYHEINVQSNHLD